MVYIQPNKYNELSKAVKDKNYPIIVSGPSGSGKSTAILRILEHYNIEHKYAELSWQSISKPLNKNLVILTHLYNVKDLANIKYNKSLIIESNLANLNKLEGYKIIRFSRITDKMAEKHGIKEFNGNLFSLRFGFKQYNPQIDFYRFLGRIFYKKLKVTDLDIDAFVHYRLDLGYSKCKLPEISCPSKKTLKLRKNFCESSSDEPEEFCQSEGKNKNCEESEVTPKSSLEFSSEIEQIDHFMKSSESNCADENIYNLKKLVKYDESPSNLVLSFEKIKVEKYLAENFLHFVDFDNLIVVYEALSLLDLKAPSNGMLLVTFVQCILEKGALKSANRAFLSFCPPKKQNETTKQKREYSWCFREL